MKKRKKNVYYIYALDQIILCGVKQAIFSCNEWNGMIWSCSEGAEWTFHNTAGSPSSNNFSWDSRDAWMQSSL